MLLRRILVPAIAAVTAVCVLAPPASAACCTSPLLLDQGVVVTGTGTTAGVFLNGLQINASCVIEATGPVAATVLTMCRLVGNPEGENHPIAAPGPVAASSFVERVTTLDFQLCWAGYAIPITDPEATLPISGCADDLGDLGLASGGLTFETY